MKSSSGAHYLALDHVRALAVYMVFTWHFLHAEDGSPVPFNAAPAFFPLSVLDEGHTGVSLFMALSGYLFAKLLEGKTIHYPTFLWNRVLRLFPLLLIVLIVKGILLANVGAHLDIYLYNVLAGVLLPTLPNGAWSITAECHFYLLLPLLLLGFRSYRLLPVLIVVMAIALRVFIHDLNGTVQDFAYYTLVGRIDQFVLGITLCRYLRYLTGRHGLVVGGLLAFTAFYWCFDFTGGFLRRPTYPSPSAWWIVLPTIEGLAYAAAIAWYDTSFRPPNTGISRWIARLGDYSYSIYLLHVFFVFSAADFVNQRIMAISNFYVACLWSLICLVLMMPIGYLSLRFVEAPFLRFRKQYVVTTPAKASAVAEAV